MSKKAVELIIGKALLDAEFRAALLADPKKALVDFSLTKAELAFLLHLDGETLEAVAFALTGHKYTSV